MVAVPAQLRRRARQARADLAALVDNLRGRHPAPLVDRGERPRRSGAEAPVSLAESAARTLLVVDRVAETADAISLVLADPAASLEVTPGQFFTVLVDIDGRTHRRAYSASGDCADPAYLRLTIKRVAGGLVSNHIHDRVRPGDELRVLGPSGNFTCAPDPARARHVVLIGGGSGITPLAAIARAILAREPASRVSLVYGNRRIEDVIFLADLEHMAADHGDRFHHRHVLEHPPAAWDGGHGLLDRAHIAAELDALPATELPAAYYLCGPRPMMDAARTELLARAVARAAIREELFTSPSQRRVTAPATPQSARVVAAGDTRDFVVAAGQTLLEAGLAAGAPMKFSCAMGGCGACKVKLRAGEVAMEEPSCLTPDEREQGYVLACVSRPCSAVELEVE